MQCRFNCHVLFPRMFDYKFAKASDIVCRIKSKEKDNTVNAMTTVKKYSWNNCKSIIFKCPTLYCKISSGKIPSVSNRNMTLEK